MYSFYQLQHGKFLVLLLSYHYDMLSPLVKESHGDTVAMQEKDLHQIFNMKSSYIKLMKTQTRLTKNENQPGVTVYS